MFILLKGAELSGQEGKSAAVLAACRTLAEELSETRFPAPRILSFKVPPPTSLQFSLVSNLRYGKIRQELLKDPTQDSSQVQKGHMIKEFMFYKHYVICSSTEDDDT